MPDLIRCPWALADPLSQKYHDAQWGVPNHDDRELFKYLNLEGQQAGLAWITILRKMDTLTEAFDGFDPEIIAQYDESKIDRLLLNPGIIRNRLKTRAVVSNAKAYLKLLENGSSLDQLLWAYVDGTPIVNHWAAGEIPPSSTPLSDQISRDLKKLGFKFIGSTIIYSFLQAMGLVNDHLDCCHFKNGPIPIKSDE
ncbi:MAG: DNA-3-methyladenine glycosylase I [Deltaproteobacteria bacterium]|jgi:DNA-3-methyladenine glycosylase I|nr:DNA-3-methyladenine glycosylase I [Deltaproteobacteria bacterium]